MDRADRSLPGKAQASDAFTSRGALGATVLRSTAVASLNQPLTTVRTGLAVMWNRPRALLTENNPFPLIRAGEEAFAPGSAEFEKALDDMGCAPPGWGRLRWLVDGAEFFPEFDRLIAGARDSIDVQVFIFDNDDIAVRYADKLRAASQTRKVRVLFDDLGSTAAHGAAPQTRSLYGFSPPADMKWYLRSGSNVKARRIHNPWLVCDHTKLIVADHGATALLGGMNIGREYFDEWHDLMVRVDGPVVADLYREFRRAWRRAGPWGDLGLLRQPVAMAKPAERGAGDVPIRILRTDPAVGIHHIHKATVLGIRTAKRRVWIENAYFTHSGVARELAAAARRGVDVRVVLPGQSDSRIMKEANFATAAFLIESGVKVFRYPGMTHMKVMICDDWAQVGSANLDTLSLRINRELNIAVSEKAAVRELENRVFLPDFQRSKQLLAGDIPSFKTLISRFLAQQL